MFFCHQNYPLFHSKSFTKNANACTKTARRLIFKLGRATLEVIRQVDFINAVSRIIQISQQQMVMKKQIPAHSS
jgi:hypothetical protein